MMYCTTLKNRLLGTILASSLLPASLGGACLIAPTDAHAEVTSSTCQIHAVLATKTGDGTVPAELDFLAEQLRSDEFAAFKSFKLLESKTLKLNLGEPGVATMRTGQQLKLQLLGADALKLQLHATLIAGDRVLVDTDYKIESNGILLIGGVRHPDGKIFFAIRCRGEG